MREEEWKDVGEGSEKSLRKIKIKTLQKQIILITTEKWFLRINSIVH
jgi:hypothetical protein